MVGPAAAIEVAPGVVLANDRPLVLMAGLNMLESRELALRVAGRLRRETDRRGMPFVFKASFDKANRSHVDSPRGPGLETGLRWLAEVRAETGAPVMTDVHAPEQAAIVAEVADLLQIPAFLCRQTDLIAAVCRADRPLHIKKMQMMAPEEMANVVGKCLAFGEPRVAVCERGTSFGYGRLIVDPLAFSALRTLGAPVTFDVTHALQLPGALGHATGGRGAFVEPLARVGVGQGIAGLFVEVHPDPARAQCDGPCALPLDAIGHLLDRIMALDALVKSWSGDAVDRGPARS
ncbi:MAG: 3-deoxy-8-phosphooctulonate synthase [Myxococcales bacterium]|nr:3-deoxy-8-phosphooctulonate synthase [Myxococcales bacterium]